MSDVAPPLEGTHEPAAALSLVEQLKRATAVEEYSAVEAALAALRSRLVGVVYDVTTKEGMEAARKDRRDCVKVRTKLEGIRKEIKAPALRFGEFVDSEAKRITGEVAQLENPIDAQIKLEDNRQAEAAAARLKAEADRRTLIDQRITWIRAQLVEAAKMTKRPDLVGLIAGLVALPMNEEIYDDRLEEAVSVKANVLQELEAMSQAMEQREAQTAELERQRAALAEQQAATKRDDDARRARIDAEDLERKQRMEREDAERRTQQAALDARHEAERARVAKVRGLIDGLRLRGAQYEAGWTAADVRKAGEELRAVELKGSVYGELLDEAQAVRLDSVARLYATAAAWEADEAAERQATAEREAAAEQRRLLELAADPWGALERVRVVADNYPKHPGHARILVIVNEATTARDLLEDPAPPAKVEA